MADETKPASVNSIELATQLTIAWLNNPNVQTTAQDVPDFLKTIHATIDALADGGSAAPAEAAAEHKPAAPIRSSVKPDYIVSLIDGRKLKSLKRHLSMHGLTPKEYRERFGLKADYPMVAPNYSAQRREVAKKLGLGRKPAKAAAAAPGAEAPAAAAKPKPAAKPKAAAKPKVVKAAAKTAPKASAADAPKPAKRGRPKKVVAPAN
jgi:predicted transcriptional regulator